MLIEYKYGEYHAVWREEFVKILLKDRLATWTAEEASALFDYYNSRHHWDQDRLLDGGADWIEDWMLCEIRTQWNKFYKHEICYFFGLNDDSCNIEYELSLNPKVEAFIEARDAKRNVNTYLVKFNLPDLKTNIYGRA